MRNKKIKILSSLFILVLLGGCKTSYTYIVITTAKEAKKPELKQSCPIPDQWNYVDVKRLEMV